MDLNTFVKRNEYGHLAVVYVMQKCNQKNITCKEVIPYEVWKRLNENASKNWDEIKRLKKFDLENGDLIIGVEYCDIKRNSLSFKSLDNFKHKYFIIGHHDLRDFLVMKADDIRKLDRNTHGEKLSSNDLGFKYWNLKRLVKHITLDDFLTQIKGSK